MLTLTELLEGSEMVRNGQGRLINLERIFDDSTGASGRMIDGIIPQRTVQ